MHDSRECTRTTPDVGHDPTGTDQPTGLVQLMGGFGFRVGGERIDLPESCQRLVAYLALAGRPRERSLVAAALWPDKVEGRAAANLRSALWRLSEVSGGDAVVSHRSTLSLHDEIAVDARTLEESGWSLVTTDAGDIPAGALEHIDRHLFLADLLPGWYEDWVIAERERLAQLQLHFLEALAYALLDAGQLAAALDVAIRLVAADTLREGSQRALLRVYCQEGSLGQARRQLATYRDELRREFACEPDLSIEHIVADMGHRHVDHAPGRRPVRAIRPRSAAMRARERLDR